MSKHQHNQVDGPREKLRQWDAQGRKSDLDKDVVAKLEALDKAGDLKAGDAALLRAYEKAHGSHGGGKPTATVDFDELIGEIKRHPTQEVVKQVKVKRSGSTQAASTQPVTVTVTNLPDGVLTAVEPAAFKAGQARNYVTMRFSPAGQAQGVVSPPPMNGKADLVATSELAAGAPQTFTVVDGDGGVVTPPSGNIFHLPGLDLGPLPFLFGMSMGDKLADKAIWVREIGRPPLCCSGGSHSAGRTATWDAIRGGQKGAIAHGTQLDVAGHSTNLSDAFDIVEPGTAQLIVATWRSVPDNVKASDYADLANGSHDDDAYVMGWNAWLLMKAGRYKGGQLVTRFDKEYDGGGYAVSEANAAQRAAFQARFIARFNQGYLDAGADERARHILGLARHDQMGPIEAHVPVGPNGQVMVDAIDVSMHAPGNPLNDLVGKPFDVQVAAVEAWIAGDYDGRPCYAPNHKDPKYSALVAAKNHGVLITNAETSPRDDGNLACEISAAAWQGKFNFWKANAPMVGLVGVYNRTALDRSLAVKNWSAGVDALVRLAKGG